VIELMRGTPLAPNGPPTKPGSAVATRRVAVATAAQLTARPR
jgi:hypothetical protein